LVSKVGAKILFKKEENIKRWKWKPTIFVEVEATTTVANA
jgi:hypothetical protein